MLGYEAAAALLDAGVVEDEGDLFALTPETLHRVELFTTHYQFIDLETEPLRWDLSNARRAQLWGMPASRRWFFEASEFPGEDVHEPKLQAAPQTLEDYLGVH